MSDSQSIGRDNAGLPRSKSMPSFWKQNRHKPILIGLLLLLLFAGLGWLGLCTIGLVSLERHEGYFAPALSPDGQSVWFFQRKASGLAVGMGWEHFSPPARVFLHRDELTLRRYDLQSGRMETLLQWPSTPLVGKKLNHYRGRILGLLVSRIQVQGDERLDYAARMSIIRQPTSQNWSISGTWAGPDSARPAWTGSDTSSAGLSDPVVVGPMEVMAVRGEESFPAAILLLDHGRRQAEVLIRNEAYERLYPEGPQFESLLQFSRKEEVDRLNEMRQTHQDLVAAFRAQGMNEGAALLAAGREMARLGWWPTPPTVTAREVSMFPAELRVFTIDPMELRVGLFPDLEEAMAHPGEPVDRSGRYIRHRDFSTSEDLNAFLATEPEGFGVSVGDRKWHMVLTPARPASR
jgi:hypothetical protein